MLVIGGDQIHFDLGVERRVFVWVFLRLLENKIGADFAEKIADQHAAGAIDEAIN